jgi:hypothetical protein
VSDERDQAVAAMLPPALELMTALTQSEEHPRFYWEAIQRVLGESLTGADPSKALAEVVFCLSALSGILLDRLAEQTGQKRVDLLAELHRDYVRA